MTTETTLDPAARSEASAPLLTASDLHITFPGRRGADPARAVDGVDLDIRRGEIVALVGESGCGKTTLARSLLGLVAPTSGRVSFDGKPLDYRGRALKAYRKRVQLVLQDPSGSLNPRHTVYEAVAEGLRIHGYGGDERAAVGEALSRAGLRPPERFFLRYPHELSGGTSCPAGSASGSSSRARWSSTPNSSSRTSRWPHWTRPCAARSSRCCCGCARNSACPRWS
ncbi:putative oligopeptide transport ATP-binding protein YkfD [Streptomyces aurantiacus JA 4570]|uniref:Putative oligopeptide transport ATP-binding protein YkfD n=1 Tax=Streptomyces aurantiacus JA 4570 TaxID=1286094 RepID=S3ZJC8_9ACTN|nr:putative oligopeptide transport ATP-binding protein YkfD [Streptomyces aurantiacus JA 4570]